LMSPAAAHLDAIGPPIVPPRPPVALTYGALMAEQDRMADLFEPP
jgi:hypothetical protein